MVHDRRVGERELTLGVSGKLIDGNLVMYDRETDSLWHQESGSAVEGELSEERLQELQGLLEVHKSNNLITLDVNGVLLIHSIMMTLVAEFVPRTEDQLSFRRRLSEILRQLSNGLLVGKGRLPESEALNGVLDVEFQAQS